MLGKKVDAGWVMVDAGWVMVGVALGGVVVLVAMVLSRQTRPAPIVIEPPAVLPTAAATATAGPIRVYVSGEVGRADVYELPAGSTVADVIRLAGDFTAAAAPERVNLAQPLVDGMQVHVPAAGAGAEAEAGPVIRIPANAAAEEAAGAGAPGTPVNINRAGVAELDTLPGVGLATAEKIVAYREVHGRFARIEDIMEVSGIGEAKFAQMRDLITVDS